MTGSQDKDLAKFFERPVKISNLTWQIGQPFSFQLNPWDLFFRDSRVVNRINHYSLLRCKLRVTILINGNSFYYGRILVSYRPYWFYNNSQFPRHPNEAVRESQRLHCFLNPTTQTGGELLLPFVWHENALSIPNAEWNQMGFLDFELLGQPLGHANNGTGSLTITVLAHAEEMDLSVPTTVSSTALIPQSGEDEYGVVSRPAMVVEKIANLASSIPIISPFARATEMGAKVVKNVAQIFGFSKPTSIEPIKPYKPNPIGNMANVNVQDTSMNLGLDPKQELTIDTRTFGLAGTDELQLDHLAGIESYIGSFEWSPSAAIDSPLYGIGISPMHVLARTLTSPPVEEYSVPACAFVSQVFKHWRGKFKIRFQVVASGHHKGRLRFTYDPNWIQDLSWNTPQFTVVDIGETTDFTFEIGWGQRTPYIELLRITSSEGGISTDFATPSATRPFELFEGFYNGVLAVTVSNELTAPSDQNDPISVNVFISTTDNEFVDPREAINDIDYLQPQSGEEEGKQENDPVQTVHHSIGDFSTPNVTDLVFFADPVKSFRALLKRYNFYRAYTAPTNLPHHVYVVTDSFPLLRGYNSSGVQSAVSIVDSAREERYTAGNMTLLNYLAPAFACRRGGVRWKYVLDSGRGAPNSTNSMLVSRRNVLTTSYVSTFGPTERFAVNIGSPGGSNESNLRIMQYQQLYPHGITGSHMTTTQVNPALEFQVPYMLNKRFTPAQAGLSGGTSEYFPQFSNPYTFVAAHDSDTNINHGVLAFCAAAEDFQLGYFVGAPKMYLYTNPGISASGISIINQPTAL